MAGRPVEFDTPSLALRPTSTRMNDDWTFEIQNLAGPSVIRADVQSPDWTLQRITLSEGEARTVDLRLRK